MLVPSWTNIGHCTRTMVHRQKYLAGGNPALTMEEAYLRVMLTITRVDDLTYECTDARFTTTNQRLEADNLHRTLVDQNTCLNFIWRNEADIDKLYNTRELVQIIDEEILAKLATMKDVIISFPGTTPRPLTPPFSGSLPRQHQRKTLGSYRLDEHSGTNNVKRTMVYSNDHMHKYADQQHSHLDDTRSGHLKEISHDRPPSSNRIAEGNAHREPRDTPTNNHTMQKLMDIDIPSASPSPSPKQPDVHREQYPRTMLSRKRSLQVTADTEPNPKERRVHNHGNRRQAVPSPTLTPSKDRKNTSDMDAMIPLDVKSDIKPDIKNLKCTNTEEENFITRVVKRSK